MAQGEKPHYVLDLLPWPVLQSNLPMIDDVGSASQQSALEESCFAAQGRLAWSGGGPPSDASGLGDSSVT